jgi:hypothetical protein
MLVKQVCALHAAVLLFKTRVGEAGRVTRVQQVDVIQQCDVKGPLQKFAGGQFSCHVMFNNQMTNMFL